MSGPRVAMVGSGLYLWGLEGSMIRWSGRLREGTKELALESSVNYVANWERKEPFI